MKRKAKQMEKSLKKYFTTEQIDGKNVYSCNTCGYESNIKLDMNYHIRKHMKTKYKFQCNHNNCDEVFKSAQAFSDHENNHLCGFGIKGMEESGVCGMNHIKKHYEINVVNNEFLHECKWISCQFSVKRLDAMERHVHKQHLHNIFIKEHQNSSKSGQNSRNRK